MSPYHIDKRWLATGKLLIANGTFVQDKDGYLSEPTEIDDEWLALHWRVRKPHRSAWRYFEYEQLHIYRTHTEFRCRLDITWHLDAYLASCAEIYCTKS